MESNISLKCKPIEYVIDHNNCHHVISHREHGKSGHIKIYRNGNHVFIHRYIYQLMNGEISKDMVVRHKCDNPKCINPDHLLIGSILDNVQDRVKRNRCARQKGVDNGASKLSEQEVINIKTLLATTNLSMTSIANKFNVSRTLVSYIRKGKLWSHINF